MSDVLSIDFETAAVVDLRRTGATLYSLEPNTRVLCMAYAFNNEPIQSWREGEQFPLRVLDHVRNGGIVRGWNVGFELVIWNNTLRRQLTEQYGVPVCPPLDPAQIEDTMAAAAYWGLSLSLGQASRALKLPIQKDAEGHALMMRMCRPRTWDPLKGTATWWHLDEPARFDRLVQYCEQDVRTERAVANSIPPLPPAERAVWALDQKINARGVGVDYSLVVKLRDMAEEAASRANQDLARLTGGAVTSINQSAKLLEWLRANGYPHDNLRKGTVEERLEDTGLSDNERRGLELRSEGAKTSAAKLTAMLNASSVRGAVGRVRGMLQYYGAFRTGRWAGRLIQPQNMPRGTIKDISRAIQMIEAGAGIDVIEALFGPALAVISSALRGCLVAEPGWELVVADFSQIEARVIAWLAGQTDILSVFASGQDVYCYTASKVVGRTVKKDDPERQLGKVLVLACGFGMSGSMFKDTAASYGIVLTEAEAVDAVRGYRDANPLIVKFWWDLDRAAKDVIARGPNCPPVRVGRVQLAMWQGHLLIRLPSGRTLCYREAKLMPGGRYGDEISYMGVNQYTRQWERVRTYGGKLAENVTQATARDVMADAILRADAELALPTTLLVHDEVIAEVPEAHAETMLDGLMRIMRTPPSWAPDLPVDAAGWRGTRYRK